MTKAMEFGRGIRILKQDFFETLLTFIYSQRSNIPKIAKCVEKTAELLYEEFGVINFSDLYNLDKEKVGRLEGYKEAKTDNLFEAIERSKKVPYSNFIYSLGRDNVGKKTAKDLAKSFGKLEDLTSAEEWQLLAVPDVGEIVAKSIKSYFEEEKSLLEIEKLLSSGMTILYEEQAADGVFNGEKVVLTGTLVDFKRDEAAKIIESLGGEVLSSVSKKTTIVLAGENAGSKLDKARALGVKIIDEETFKGLISLDKINNLFFFNFSLFQFFCFNEEIVIIFFLKLFIVFIQFFSFHFRFNINHF